MTNNPNNGLEEQPTLEQNDTKSLLPSYSQRNSQKLLELDFIACIQGTTYDSFSSSSWADTPAVATSMPDFYKTFYKVLRTPDEGSDTMWWLGATSKLEPEKLSGEFFRDRMPEIKHFWLGATKYTKPQAEDLWKWCAETCKWTEDELKNKL
jgi:dehydrogenase/reductase SDR family protein 12